MDEPGTPLPTAKIVACPLDEVADNGGDEADANHSPMNDFSCPFRRAWAALVLAVVMAMFLAPGAPRVRASPPSASDWPRFRGPNGSGVSKARNLPLVVGEETNMAWHVAVPPGSSSPIVAGDGVFLTAFEGEHRWTLCFDLQTGVQRWRRSVESVRFERKTKPNDPASSTPCTDGTRVYVLFSGFGLVAYSLAGDEQWRRPLGPFNPPHGMASSPILADGNVIILADQVTHSHLAAFDAVSGREKWRVPRGDFVGGYATPILSGGEVVVSGPVELIGYATDSGARRWSLPRMGVMPVGSPVAEGGLIFVYNDAVPPFESLAREMRGDRNGDGKLEPDEFPDPSFKEAVLAIDRAYGNGDGAVDQKEWDSALRLMNTMNAFVAARRKGNKVSEVWRVTKLLADAASPLLYQDVLYLVRNGGLLSSVDPTSGRILRQERVPGFEGQIFASPVAADGKVYLTSAAGKIAVIAAGREWTTLQVNSLPEGCYATPALAGDMMLVRSERSLWAFRKRPKH